MIRTCLLSLAVCSSGCFGGLGINESMGFKMKAAEVVHASLFPGGATAVYVVTHVSGGPAQNVLVTSSNPDVVKVSGPTDANGEVTLTSGVIGEAQISVPNPRTRPDQFTVKVVAAGGLRREGSLESGPASIVAGETVSLSVVGVAFGDQIYGSGKITFTVDGTLTLQQGTAIDGEARVHFSGQPGMGTVKATNGTHTFEQTIKVVRADTLVIDPTITTSGTKKVIGFELKSPDSHSPNQSLQGGGCTWTGAAEIEDRTRVDVIAHYAGRSATVTMPETGSVTVTCQIGQTSKAIVLR